ncbi:MAG TPA: hypothetical protein VFJ17_11665 [Mycobacteriales bacterium]|jgi:hypothetical protein|nr:hypothetical protein [Mycobacteriales bacterium]
MNSRAFRRPRYADVAATLALVLALGGTAYATGTVGTSDIKDGAVTTAKLHYQAVTSSKIANGSVTLADLKGINQTGTISFSLVAGGCGKLTFSVSGASAGQAALLTWIGSVPTHVVMGPLKVVSSSTIIGYACNLGASNVSASNIGVRIVTFG